MGWAAVPCWLVSFGDAHLTDGVSGCMLAVFSFAETWQKERGDSAASGESGRICG